MASLMVVGAGMCFAQQPYTGCWHPQDIKNWSPETDVNAKFNRSKIPLAPRFKEPEVMKANPNQHYEGQVCNATILFNMCSSSPSQGANNFTAYQPSYWQYTDKVVYWAGSASEGIICPPPAYSIDAAHLNGVKILGQIFFAPSAFGGQVAWVDQMLTKENGEYIYARKLYEIAKYHGFDGWFINQEIDGTRDDQFCELIKQFNAIADAAGDTQMEIQWYEAHTSPNAEILKTHPNTSTFLEYGSVGDKRSFAEKIGCTVEQTYSKIYAGIQCVNNGLTGYGETLRKAFKKDGHVGSVDLFCPEERIWKDNVSYILNTDDECGEKAYRAQAKTFENEDKMWVNLQGDPSYIAGDSDWPGFSGCLVERSNISHLPFVTSFANGLGKHRFVKGEKRGTQDWNNTGIQSVLPTWRWWIENKDGLTVKPDWDDAYNFGSSYKISGIVTAGDHLMRLYKTMLKIDGNVKFRLIYKTSVPGSLQVVLGTESNVSEGLVTLSQPTTSNVNGWTVDEYDLSSLDGKTIYMIALNIKVASEQRNYFASLGQMEILPANYTPQTVAVSNLKNSSTPTGKSMNLRLTWDYEYNNDFDRFDIYLTSGGMEKLVGQTRGEGFYIPTFNRTNNESSVRVRIVPVLKNGTECPAEILEATYPEAAPSIILRPSKSYVNVGEEISISAVASNMVESYQWQLPDQLELVSGAGTSTVKVRCKVAGTFAVTVKATNAKGTTSITNDIVDVFDDVATSGISNIALHKLVTSYNRAAADDETPDNLIDGVSNPDNTSDKWCVDGSNNNWCVIDLGNMHRIYGFKIYDSDFGPEKGNNINNYRIMLSTDGEIWTPYVDETGRHADAVKEDYITPATARYVRLNPYAEENFVMRLWEFEVYGKLASDMSLDLPETLNLDIASVKNLQCRYNLGGEQKSSNFSLTAVSSSPLVEVGDIKEMDNGLFDVELITKNEIGQCDLTFKLINGDYYYEKTITVNVDTKSFPNILSNKQALLRWYKSDYAPSSTDYEEEYCEGLTDGDTTTDALASFETESRNQNDFWTIFDLGETMDLGKISIHIPNNNVGENSNGKESEIFNDISIRISDDGERWSTVHHFKYIGQSNLVEFFAKEAVSTRYLAIVGNLKVYSYPALAEIEAFAPYNAATRNILTGIPANISGALTGTSVKLTDGDESTSEFYQSNELYPKPLDITFDTMKEYSFNRFTFSGDGELTSILVSTDGNEWVEAVPEIEYGESEWTLPTPVKGRFVRFRFDVMWYGNVLAKEFGAYGDAFSGIEAVVNVAEKTIVAIYTLQGVQVANPTSGIYIVRYSDGSTRKVFIK